MNTKRTNQSSFLLAALLCFTSFGIISCQKSTTTTTSQPTKTTAHVWCTWSTEYHQYRSSDILIQLYSQGVSIVEKLSPKDTAVLDFGELVPGTYQFQGLMPCYDPTQPSGSQYFNVTSSQGFQVAAGKDTTVTLWYWQR